MTSTIEQDQIVKTDARGRVRFFEDKRVAILAEFGRSGLSAVKFSALAGVKYQTFAGWLQRAKRAAGAKTALTGAVPAVQWLEAVVEKSVSGGRPGQAPVVIHLTGNVKVELANETQVGLVIKLMRGLQAC